MNASQVKSAAATLGNVVRTKSTPTTPAAPHMSPTLQAPVGKGTGLLGVMHEGGVVPKTGDYTLKKGETVTPAPEDKSTTGRNSEYRKVYLARRQARQGGGNTPAKGEKHDQKKA